jgi:hypothetical protein
MRHSRPSRKTVENSIIWTVISITAAVLIYNHFIFDADPGPTLRVTVLDDLQKQSLDVIKDLTQLLISVATALLGAVGVFVMQHYKDGRPLKPGQFPRAVTALSFAALSIDSGYIYLEKLAETLGNNMFVPFAYPVALPQALQFAFFFIALLIFAAFATAEIAGTERVA